MNPIKRTYLNCDAALVRGISLVEVMVSMVLGSLLILAVTQVFLSNSQTGRLDSELARTHDRARFAFDEFERVMRQIGHSSCSPPNAVGNWVTGANIVTNLMHQSPVRGWEQQGTGLGNESPYVLPGSLNLTNATDTSLPAEFTAPLAPGSDIVILNHIRSQATTISSTSGTGAVGNSLVCNAGSVQPGNTISINPLPFGVVQGSLVFFEKSCQGGDIFQVANANVTDGLTRAGAWGEGLCTQYSTGDEVAFSLLEPILFFIGMNDGEPSLFRQVIRAANPAQPELLVEGVESMQITYGLQSVSGMRRVDRYVDASGVTDWDEVASVRIGLLLRSANNALDAAESRTFNVNGTQVQTPADRRARIVKTATIAIRNRT